MVTSEDFGQLRLCFTGIIQHDWVLIQPVVLFTQVVAETSSETDIDRTTVGEKARRFVIGGMLGLEDLRKGRAGRLDLYRSPTYRVPTDAGITILIQDRPGAAKAQIRFLATVLS